MENKFTKLIVIILVIAFCSCTANAKLVALYEFDGDPNDCVGQHNKPLTWEPGYQNGIFGKAINFDGAQSYIEIPQIGTGYRQFSYALWFKADTAPHPQDPYAFIHTHEFLRDNATHFVLMPEFLDYPYAVELTIIHDKGGGIVWRPIEKFVGEWRHIAAVYDGTSIKIYLDGRLANVSCAIEPNQKVMLGSSLIGAIAWSVSDIGELKDIGNIFDGLFDDIAIFDHALSDVEVTQLYYLGGASFILKEETKGMLSKLEQIHSESGKMEPRQAIQYLKEQINEYEQWKKQNDEHYRLPYSKIYLDPYWLLAKSEEKAGDAKQKLIEAYTQVAMQSPEKSNYVAALLWLYNNVSGETYTEIVKKSAFKGDLNTHGLYIAVPFELNQNWDAFELFLDAMFSEVDSPYAYAETMEKGLQQNKVWVNKLIKYCRNKEELTEYAIERDVQQAQEFIKGQAFLKAAEIYRGVMNRCKSQQDKVAYEFKVYECHFQSGQYETVIQKLKNFIKKYQATYKMQIIKAMLLTGRAYIQLGEIDKAIESFKKVINEYPENKQLASEAKFFNGYCYTLEGRFDKARETLSFVIQNYPQSSYISKARFILRSMKDRTE